MEEEISRAVAVLMCGGNILYPTDTIWGIGCDAADETAVKKIFQIKQREESKSLIILLDDSRKLQNYVEHIPSKAFQLLSEAEKPLTIIYPNARNLARNVIAADGSVAIRVTKDEFCKKLIQRFGKPIVSTSANISGTAPPKNFREIQQDIIRSVDYVVCWRQEEKKESVPSSIIRLKENGGTEIIRA